MRYLLYSVFIGIALTIAGCGIGPRVATLQDSADNAIESGDYNTALHNYEEIIELKSSRSQEISGMTYYNAGISAWQIDKNSKAVEYLELALNKGFESEKCFYILARAYKDIDNLSLEMSSLRSYIAKYPDGEHIDIMQKRLFEAYFEIENYDSALELWPDLQEKYAGDPDIMDKYFIIHKRLGNEEVLRETAEKLVALDENNVNALEYLGEYYFWKAENRYQKEMAAYEKNQTRRQYRQLLEALDEINEQFKIALDYFERLYQIDQSPQYATYLGNIYKRFGNEEKAEYFYGKSEM